VTGPDAISSDDPATHPILTVTRLSESCATINIG
jgi:hypothetical protein